MVWSTEHKGKGSETKRKRKSAKTLGSNGKQCLVFCPNLLFGLLHAAVEVAVVAQASSSSTGHHIDDITLSYSPICQVGALEV